MPWKIRCTVCNTERILNISFDIGAQKTIYIYCNICKRNTFNEIL